MRYTITSATKKIDALKSRLHIVQGGTSAGKTIGTLQVLIDKCQKDNKGDVTSVVSESFPHLKRGAMRDFLDIMKNHGYFKDSRWNKSDFIYTFETGAILEFFSADQPAKTRGPRRKRLFINEANNVPLETFEQLEVRTDEEIYIDYNPTWEFWVHTEILNRRNDYDFIVLTYKDNEALSQNIIDSIEQRKDRPRWWRVYGLGELGEAEGRIYTDWQIIDEVPFEARYEGAGIDFGYHPDPAAIIDAYYYNGGYILDEILYGTRLENSHLATALKNRPTALHIADSAEPKSISEISRMGVNIVGTAKGADSVRYGVKAVQGLKISVTSRSLNLIKEYRNYFQAVDRRTNNAILGKYDGDCHALDAARYKLCSLIPVKQKQEQRRVMGEALRGQMQASQQNPV